MDSLTGKTIKWTFVDGPMPGTTFEHTFASDGSVTWRFADGPQEGASGHEKSYGAAKVSETTMAISYLAASGYTLTVVLNPENGRMFGFASNNKEWYALKGTFEFAK